MARADHLTLINGGNEARGSEKWAETIRAETKSLTTQIDENYMELAERLYLIFDTPKGGDRSNPPVYTTWGFASFDEYVGVELGIHPKRAQRLKRIWYKLGLQLSELEPGLKKKIVQLGFSKVRELVSVLTPRNAEAWTKKAENLTYLQLCKQIEKYKAERDLRQAQRDQEAQVNGSSPLSSSSSTLPSGDEDPDEGSDDEPSVSDMKTEDLTTKSFSLYPDQLESVELAIKRAQELSNSSKRSHNLSLICLDFLATNNFSIADEAQRLKFLVKFEKLLGFKFIVVDPVAEEVVYGIKTLEKLARGANK